MSKYKSVFVCLVVFGLSLALATQCSAGLVVNALSAWNDDNDKLTDYSWSVSPETSVVVGIARIDRVETDNHQAFDFTLSKTAWLAFAFQVDGSVSETDPYGSKFTGWMKHKAPTSSTYQLSTLLNNSNIPSTAMFVLLELNSSPSQSSEPHLWNLQDGIYASEKGVNVYAAGSGNDVFDNIVSLGFSWIAAFGIDNTTTKDFLYFNYLLEREVFGLSVLAAGPGLNSGDFKNLFPVNDKYGIDETQYQFGSIDYVSVYSNTEKPSEFKDSGIAGVNYVPEPGSFVSLLGLALIGLGSYFVRQRKS